MGQYPKDQYGIPKDRTEEYEEAHEALIGSQVGCIKQYISDFNNEAKDCKYNKPFGCIHRKATVLCCRWAKCPLHT
jgi:hypothetical protein